MKGKHVSKELHKKLPQAGRPRISWQWHWFSRAKYNIRAALRERRFDLLWLAFYMSTRGANFYQFWIGPVSIMWPARWLSGSARQLHPKEFAEHFKDAAGNDS